MPAAQYLLKLYRRTVTYGHLPDAGGILDQEERVMDTLDRIHELVTAHEKRRRKDPPTPEPGAGAGQRSRAITFARA